MSNVLEMNGKLLGISRLDMALSLLKELSLIDKNVIIAGGYATKLFLGYDRNNTCNTDKLLDIDIYFSSDKICEYLKNVKKLKKQEGKYPDRITGFRDMYEDEENNIDFIHTSKNPVDVITQEFDINMCKCYIKYDYDVFRFITTREFEDGLKNKTIVMNKQFTQKDDKEFRARLYKYSRRFPDFLFKFI